MISAVTGDKIRSHFSLTNLRNIIFNTCGLILIITQITLLNTTLRWKGNIAEMCRKDHNELKIVIVKISQYLSFIGKITQESS